MSAMSENNYATSSAPADKRAVLQAAKITPANEDIDAPPSIPPWELNLAAQASSNVRIDHIIKKVEAKTKNYDSKEAKKDVYDQEGL